MYFRIIKTKRLFCKYILHNYKRSKRVNYKSISIIIYYKVFFNISLFNIRRHLMKVQIIDTLIVGPEPCSLLSRNKIHSKKVQQRQIK